ncbi:Gfo/Idh/MocA family protein [Streptomyces spectabilis]|uniref:Gfo/Idh/MocA family oxidoreductase n=1 Tax=Streptomyces spectabilis TaxID=68270 RepID=A0A5P2X461_STRST|nr:Gfo/Idh/MocA family oxidoreductase [Streptomyces spectabilis]MBB5108554.1 putative dehydrogenase [Streptomyces spectabilis]MCI3901769.1 Gfo/Idh/MocA family oxidoreductase [Streptomyces spectabilis]QEV59201.1 gfo/Idh/MocA family oxidoreductase [Streptomyces spectabilis]GGV47226.1 oxidoreductase [Streptomyces spectabilis]
MEIHTQNPVRAGIVGLSARGGWAPQSHLPALARLDGYEVLALAASSPASAAAAGAAYGVPRAYAGAGELVRDPDVELVVVSVRVPLHREVILAALAAGKAVLSEWPLGNGLAEAEELAAAAAAAGVRTFAGLQARSAPAVRYVRDLVADGFVGEVLSTSLVASGRRWGPTFEPGGGYLLDRDNGGTMLTIPFGHTVDALAMVLGEFTEVSATTATRRPVVREEGSGRAAAMTVADQIAVSGRLTSGAVASVHFRGGLARGTNFHWEINGTDGDLVVTGDHGHLQQARLTLRGARGAEGSLRELTVPERYFDVPALDALRGEVPYNIGVQYADVLRDLREGTFTVPDFGHAARRQRLLDAIERAAGTGVRVAL